MITCWPGVPAPANCPRWPMSAGIRVRPAEAVRAPVTALIATQPPVVVDGTIEPK